MIRFLDLRAIHESIADELSAAVQRVVSSGWFILGPEVDAFEAEWAAHVGARHCVSVGNGLDALTLTLRALGAGPGDEVVVPSHTFVATWLAVAASGATPVPAEVSLQTFNVTRDTVAAVMTGRTVAVMPVHLYGAPCDVSDFHDLGVPIVEDAAQAHGARWSGVRVGRGVACWSFYPGKNLGALGDGGAVTTDDDGLAERLRLLRNYGSRAKYVHEFAGVNSRLDELQAAALRVKLRYLDGWNDRRRQIAARYSAALADVVRVPEVPDDADPVWHLYVIRTRGRDQVAYDLRERGVETLIHYPTPPHRQAAFSSYGYDLPIADELAAEVLSLPMGPHLSDADVDQVIDAVLASTSRVVSR